MYENIIDNEIFIIKTKMHLDKSDKMVEPIPPFAMSWCKIKIAYIEKCGLLGKYYDIVIKFDIDLT